MMEAWQERVIAERVQLEDRIIALERFRQSDEYLKIPFEDKNLLIEQHNAMKIYSDVLGQRIHRFETYKVEKLDGE